MVLFCTERFSLILSGVTMFYTESMALFCTEGVVCNERDRLGERSLHKSHSDKII